MQHLDEGTIHAWLDGALSTIDAERAAAHVATCAECAAAVAEARGMIAGSARIISALDDVPGGVIPRHEPAAASASSLWRRLRLTPARAALAATILLAVSTTLTLRNTTPSPNASSSKKDSAVAGVAVQREAAPAALAAAAPKPASSPAQTTLANGLRRDSMKFGALDSVRVSTGARSQLANAVVQRKTGAIAGGVSEPTASAERREFADAVARRDSTQRDSTKVRVAQDIAASVVAGAAAPAPAPPALAARSLQLQQVVVTGARDATSAVFEGCYRLSADSAAGSNILPHGLPGSFRLSRTLDEPRPSGAAAAVRADSTRPMVAWRQLSTNQATVTFANANTQQVSLVLTAGSPVGVASSGDQKTTVRVARAQCSSAP